MMASDPNRILRLIPLFAGALGGILLLLNRLTTVQLTESQARSDVVGVILSGVLILVGLIWQQIQPRSPDAVTLIGEEGIEFNPNLSDSIKTELAWASVMLLKNTVTQSLVVYYQDQVLLRRGILGENSQVTPGKILKRVLETQKPVYLVNLTLYPGKIEFDYLPLNTQGVICQPLGSNGAIILGANIPRSYTKQDENWLEGIADKLTLTLESELNPTKLQ
ncbi:cofactor assembly of complex C subunit B [Crocosphaera sp.]|uniref:cofactor assembly of complex C subunit B n=1 Tax=Crocosphaera sp. TaxID=2729996 RepID=UPI002621B120|nr:cofactor assembly of complex C subunit B [Crocosphaera sp.]MDJ0580928.1 cofactor assembly of complex C subunit B [Crocosphaera sp.]